MGSLYIGGAQSICADFSNSEDCEEYDEQQEEMVQLAKKYNLAISRYALDEQDYSFVIMNKKADHKCFYEGAAFEVDMSVEISETFEDRAKEFINELNKTEKFSVFHNLNWSSPKVLYFVVS